MHAGSAIRDVPDAVSRHGAAYDALAVGQENRPKWLGRGARGDRVTGNAKTAAELVSAAKQGIENLTVDQVATEAKDGQTVLVDLRESEERVQNGFIPGAVHLPRGMLEFYADPSRPYYRTRSLLTSA